MQFSNFSKSQEGLAITFYSEYPISNVGVIKYYKDNSTPQSGFAKKEFRWSFNNEYWSAWETLTQNNISSVDTHNNYYFFLQIRYTLIALDSGTVSSFTLNYNEGTAINCVPCGDTNERNLINDIKREDASAILIHDVLQTYKIVPITDASFLNGYPGSWYLDRSHQWGYQPISSITNLQTILNQLSNTSWVSLAYIDGSLAIRDASISWIINQNYLKESSLNIGQGFAWAPNGQLYVDVSVVAGSVNQFYVDSSLLARDASISWLFANKQPIGAYIRDTSNGIGLFWNNGFLDVSVAGKNYDASISDIYSYIDGSLVSRDSSITALFSKNTQQDSLIAWLINNHYLKESSIGTGYKWNLGKLDVSVNIGILDPSYNILFDMIIENSTNIGGVNYDSSNFIFNGNNLEQSISNLDSIMGLLAPARPNLLTNKTLLLTNSAVYAAKLPTGLTGAWYYDSIAPGAIINDYAVDNTFRLTTPSFVDTFRAGFFGNTDTRGTLYGYVNGVLDASYNMTTGFGNTPFSTTEAIGILRFNNEAGYGGINSDFWRRVEAYIDITTQQTGGVKYSIGHSEALISNEFFLRFDPSPGLAKWSISPSASEGALSVVYLSGIEYYGINSKILVSFTAGSGIFKNAYHSLAVGKITSAYGSQILLNPLSVPNYNDTFVVTNQQFTFDIANLSTGATYPTLAVTLYKPNFTGDSSTLTLAKRLNTYSPTRATVTTEYFTDESKRILTAAGTGGTDGPWTSSDYAIFNPGNGAHAQVQNGTLRYPVSVDYANFAFSGTDKQYLRRFTKSGALSSGILTFGGFNPLTDSSSYGNGNTNLIMWLTDQNIYYDLALEFGTGGDGSSISLAKGAWTARSSNAIAWSLGTTSLGNELTHTNQFALIVIFRNTSKSMTQITLS
jgi:hypothetical protein